MTAVSTTAATTTAVAYPKLENWGIPTILSPSNDTITVAPAMTIDRPADPFVSAAAVRTSWPSRRCSR